jgi:hypothetical protein
MVVVALQKSGGRHSDCHRMHAAVITTSKIAVVFEPKAYILQLWFYSFQVEPFR